MTEYHAEIIRTMQTKSAGTGYNVPSPAFTHSGGYFVDYVAMRSLLCEFPAPEIMGSVDGTVQFGGIANYIELTAFALAFLITGEPCVPVSLNVNCVRPMMVLHGPINVEVKVRNRSKSLVFLEAKATSGENRTVATAAITLTVGAHNREG